MSPEQRQQLREAAIVAQRAIADRWERFHDGVSRPPARPWTLQTSNSFRRLGMHGDGDVLCATTHRADQLPDLSAPPGVLEYLVAAQPSVVLALLDQLDAAEAAQAERGEAPR